MFPGPATADSNRTARALRIGSPESA